MRSDTLTVSRFSYGNIITSTSDFGAFWATLASQFVNNDHVIFDTSTLLLLLTIEPMTDLATRQ
jgi:hypothetical protein